MSTNTLAVLLTKYNLVMIRNNFKEANNLLSAAKNCNTKVPPPDSLL